MKININDYYTSLLNGKEIVLPNVKSWQYVKDNNKDRLDYIAISDDIGKICYGELFEQWAEHARVYSALGITGSNNSRVLTLMPNVISTNAIDYGLDMTGAVCDFIDPTSSYEVIKKYIFNEKITDIAVLDLLYEQRIKGHVEELKKEFGIRNIVTYHDYTMMSILPPALRMILNGKYSIHNFDRDIIRFEDAKRNTRFQNISYDNNPESLSLITHTSGTTTGVGKPIPITDLNRNSLLYQHDLAGLVFEPGLKMLHFIPYFAAYGAVNTAHLGLYQGMELIELPLFKPEDFGKLLLKYKPNIVLGNTPAWLSLLSDPTLKNADLSFLQAAISGGTPTNPADEERLNRFLISHGSKCILSKGHGLSELCGCGSYTLEGYNDIGDMGVPLPLTDYLIRDVETNEILNNNGEIKGEALISSPNLSSGVLDGNVVFATEEINGKLYLPTKDIVIKHADGSLKFVERKDRMFPRFDAYNIYPLNIETLLSSFDYIDDCAVVSYFDNSRNGMVPKVYLKINDNVDNSDLSNNIYEIIETFFINSKENDYYKANFRDIPVVWEVVENIPKNTMGKTNITALNSGDISGVEYIVDMDCDNLGVKNFSVSKSVVKVLKK